MVSKRERYERANMRGGLGVRKRLSDESMRDTFKLNGVRAGFAVARCYDKYGRWELGGTIGVIVRKTGNTVQIRWADDPDEIKTYDQGDARYEVYRERWRILGMVQGNPLDPDNPMSAALTELRGVVNIEASADAELPPTEEHDMTAKPSKAATEREAAKRAVTNGELKDRETYTAKQVATRCGTDSKTMRKFFRTDHSTIEPVGQGGRYEFAAEDLPTIKREFDAWTKRAQSRSTRKPADSTPIDAEDDTAKKARRKREAAPPADEPAKMDWSEAEPDPWAEGTKRHHDRLEREANTLEVIEDDDEEPTPEQLAEIDDLDLDLDD